MIMINVHLININSDSSSDISRYDDDGYINFYLDVSDEDLQVW